MRQRAQSLLRHQHQRILFTPALSDSGYLPTPLQFPGGARQFDPTAVASPNSDNLWIGTVAFEQVPNMPSVSALTVWRNPAGTGLLQMPGAETMTVPAEFLDDKGMLAVGPSDEFPEAMYTLFTRKVGAGCGCCYMMWGRWDSADPPALVPVDPEQRIDPEDDPSPCDRLGFGVTAQVIQSGPRAGWVVAAYRVGGSDAFSNHIEWCFNEMPIDGSPAGWSVARPLTFTTIPGSEQIHGFDPGPSIPGTSQLQNFPSMARDPNDPNIVYIAFAGSPDDLASDDQNVDVYVARIFFTAKGPTTLVSRITDAMLGDAAGTDQCYPAVTVDQYGGINIAYVRFPIAGQADPIPLMTISYARFTSFGATNPLVLHLTPEFPISHHPFNQTGVWQRIGEYISIDSSGCLIYVAYPQCEPDYNYMTTNMYVSRINACLADTDKSGLVDLNDVATFNAAFLTQAPAADVDRDGACTGNDVAAFLNA